MNKRNRNDDGPPGASGPDGAQRYLEIVERVREQARGAPDSKLTLETAAQDAGLSAARLHQVFEAVQRESFGSYVRRAKLEHACGLMRAFPDWTCTRIAFEAGYSESSEFSRSFKREYGVAPSRWDRVKPLNRVAAKPEAASDDGLHDADAVFPDHAPDASTPVSIRSRPEERLAVLAVPDAIDSKNLAAAFDRLEEFLSRHGQIRPDRCFMGLSYDSNLDTKPALIRFELAYPIDPNIDGDADVLARVLPQTDVAVLPCRGGVKDFIAAWDYLLRGFLPTSKWKFGRGPHREIYYADPRKFGMAYWDMDCIIPIQMKQEGRYD